MQQMLSGKIDDDEGENDFGGDEDPGTDGHGSDGDFDPGERFKMMIVDVNRTNKATKAGGVQRFSAMVVVGNGSVGVLDL
jgi:Ribosomal protein S5, N-terminal domain